VLTIGSRRPGGDTAASDDDLVGLLLACHARIRSFTELARRLAAGADAPPEQVAGAAAGCARYFAVALPLHAADEDRSLRPRLERAAGGALAAPLGLMSDEHGPIERLIDEELCPAWRLVAAEPGRVRELARALGTGAQRLAELFDRHLPPEEEVIFPAVRRWLSPAEQAAVIAEMRARRRPA